jgi:hypothetical protein
MPAISIEVPMRVAFFIKVLGTRGLLASCMALLALSGCVSAPYEGKYAWSEGWRKAEVVAIQTAAEMERPRFYTCVRRTPAEQLTTTKFAVVKYRQMSLTQRHAVPLRAGDKVAAGEKVFVKVDGCSTPLVHQAPSSQSLG